MDIKDVLSILLGLAFAATAVRAVIHRRYILACSLICLLCIPLARFGVVPRDVGYLFDNIGAFGLIYKINWFLEHFLEVKEPPLEPPVNSDKLPENIVETSEKG